MVGYLGFSACSTEKQTQEIKILEMFSDNSTLKSGFGVTGMFYDYCIHSEAKNQTFNFGLVEKLNVTSASCQHIDYIFKATNIWVEHRFF